MTALVPEPEDAGAGDAPEPPRLPAPQAEPSRHRGLTWVAVVSGALTLLLIGSDLTPGAFGMGLLLAVGPVPLYVAMPLWLDGCEPEPAVTLAQTFAWGASVAVLLSICINSVAEVYAERVMGVRAAEIFAAVVSAPVVEEVSKGLALLFLYHELRDE